MNNEVRELPESHQQALDLTPECERVKVTLLDEDDLPLASGTAVLPTLVGIGVFWPSCPMPADGRLATAKGFSLPGGETLRVTDLTLCAGTPPHYDFRVIPP
jgi:hypothetical protein